MEENKSFWETSEGNSIEDNIKEMIEKAFLKVEPKSKEDVYQQMKELGLIPDPLFYAIIPNFTNSIVISNRMQLKPYLKGRKTPKVPSKYLTSDYGYNAANKLIHIPTGEVIASNANKVGMPRLWNVNFQDIYSGRIKEQARAGYIEKLKAYIFPYLEEQQLITEKNLRCELRFKLLDKTKNNIDIDNISGIWFKAILDVAKTTILPEDNNYIVSALTSSVEFVTNESDTRLEIILWSKE